MLPTPHAVHSSSDCHGCDGCDAHRLSHPLCMRAAPTPHAMIPPPRHSPTFLLRARYEWIKGEIEREAAAGGASEDYTHSTVVTQTMTKECDMARK